MTLTDPIRKALPGFKWQAVEPLAYKPEGSAPFRDISRQLLFRTDGLGCELRYFEIAPGGHSTLERHEHEHAVMILTGAGHGLVGERVLPVAVHDLLFIPAHTWHQFCAGENAPLGFLCMVNVERDRPQLPDANDLADLRKNPAVARFIRL